MTGRNKTDIHTEEKKRKNKGERNNGNNAIGVNIEGDNGISVRKKKKEKTSTSRKRKGKNNSLVRRPKSKNEINSEERKGGMADICPSECQEVAAFEEHRETDFGATIKPCKSKKAKKGRRKEENFVEGVKKSPERGGEADHGEIYIVSSGDQDCSKGMKSSECRLMVMPGMVSNRITGDYLSYRVDHAIPSKYTTAKVLQQQIDDFITSHEEKLEHERKEREARPADGGWTVVIHHKGRKKTADSESGIVVGSVAQAAVENKMTKKKCREVGPDFYRFQKKEAQRNEIMMLQSKFEDDKKRLQQLRAARKFRPY